MSRLDFLVSRCEDICWIRTNIKNPGHSKNLDPRAVFQRTKEHCLMGIKGTVRRSTDGDFIHANVDIDLIISEENEYGSLEKPVEIFHIIEHFCLGMSYNYSICSTDYKMFFCSVVKGEGDCTYSAETARYGRDG